MSFPVITIADMVRLQKMLVEYLGIRRLLSVVGGSMGGMQVLEWVVAYPDAVVSAMPIATTARHSAQQIAFNEVGRQAIMADPEWNNGDYYEKKPPAQGISGRSYGRTHHLYERRLHAREIRPALPEQRRGVTGLFERFRSGKLSPLPGKSVCRPFRR